jgi:hypothetical protein
MNVNLELNQFQEFVFLYLIDAMENPEKIVEGNPFFIQLIQEMTYKKVDERMRPYKMRTDPYMRTILKRYYDQIEKQEKDKTRLII